MKFLDSMHSRLNDIFKLFVAGMLLMAALVAAPSLISKTHYLKWKFNPSAADRTFSSTSGSNTRFEAFFPQQNCTFTKVASNNNYELIQPKCSKISTKTKQNNLQKISDVIKSTTLKVKSLLKLSSQNIVPIYTKFNPRLPIAMIHFKNARLDKKERARIVQDFSSHYARKTLAINKKQVTKKSSKRISAH